MLRYGYDVKLPSHRMRCRTACQLSGLGNGLCVCVCLCVFATLMYCDYMPRLVELVLGVRVSAQDLISTK